MSGPPARRRTAVKDVGDVAVVAFVDRRVLDELVIQSIGDEFARLIDEHLWRKVLLDFGNVEFLSSAVLGKLITLHRKLQLVQGKLVLCKLTSDIHELFHIVRLDRFFTIITDPARVGTDELIDAAFGNPFAASPFSAEWRTDTALALARQMVEASDFSAMPILADALQDAGCDDEALLADCRSAALTPVRGRWRAEQVLGRV